MNEIWLIIRYILCLAGLHRYTIIDKAGMNIKYSAVPEHEFFCIFNFYLCRCGAFKIKTLNKRLLKKILHDHGKVNI